MKILHFRKTGMHTILTKCPHNVHVNGVVLRVGGYYCKNCLDYRGDYGKDGIFCGHPQSGGPVCAK